MNSVKAQYSSNSVTKMVVCIILVTAALLTANLSLPSSFSFAQLSQCKTVNVVHFKKTEANSSFSSVTDHSSVPSASMLAKENLSSAHYFCIQTFKQFNLNYSLYSQRLFSLFIAYLHYHSSIVTTL